MFSSILEFFQRLQEAKLRKQKRKTRKEIKKEEIKILKKKDDKQLGTARDKAKKTKPVKESNEKENKLRLKIILLRIIKWIVQMIETFITFLISLVGVMGFCIILIVLVLMIAIYGLLHIDFDVGSGEFFDNSNYQQEDCIQGSEVLSGGLSDLNLGQLMGTLTPYQQNLVKTFQLVEEFVHGDGTNKPIYDTLPEEVAVKVYRGIPAVESGFEIFGTSDTTHDVLEDILDRNVSGLTSYNDYWASAPRDNFIGPHQIAIQLNGNYYSIDNSEYKKGWDGSQFIEDWMLKYPIPDSSIKHHFWMPYSVAMSIMHTHLTGIYGVMDDSSSSFEAFKSFTYDRMKHFGIEANKDECFQYIRAFLSLSCYLEGHGMSFLNYDISGGGNARIDFFCALFAASSDVDSQRSFENYSVVLNESTRYKYSSHDSFASSFYGTNYAGKKYGSLSVLDTISVNGGSIISLNGTPLTVPVIRYVYEKYKDDPEMTNCWNHLISVSGQQQTSYGYGFSCLLQGNHIVAELGIDMPLASGGNPEDCNCYEVQESSDVEFENFLFVGDSFTANLESIITTNGHKHASATGAYPSQFIGSTVGMKEIGAVIGGVDYTEDIQLETNVNGIVVLLGVNRLNEHEEMKDFLTELLNKYDVPIFVQQVFPIASSYSGSATLSTIESYNSIIKSFCDSTQDLYFIDTTSGFVDSNGYLELSKADSQGLHIASTYNQDWWSNIEGAINSKLSTVSSFTTRIECYGNDQLGENYTIDYENGANTLKNFLAIAMKPVGECMYSWGGGRDEYMFAKGVSPRWKEFYLESYNKEVNQGIAYNYTTFCDLNDNNGDGDFDDTYYDATRKCNVLEKNPNNTTRANGLDCSGFVSWVTVNNRERVGSNNSYLTGASTFGTYSTSYGFGTLNNRSSADFSYLPGDIYYNSGHVWICIGPSEHGGCVFVHASPDGVQINGFGGGEKTAYEYMSKYWPDFLVFSKSNCHASSYAGTYDQFSWNILDNSDTTGKGIKDPEGFRNKTAEEILEYLFNPKNSTSVVKGEYKNTVGQPQGVWNTNEGQKTTLELINSMKVGEAWGAVPASSVTNGFITRVKNFVPYMGEAVHAEGGNPTCSNTDSAKRVLTETKFKAPYYHQGSSSGDERWGNLKSGSAYESTSSDVFNSTGCHTYSLAYALTVTQGRLINPPEALVIGWYGGLWAGGMGGSELVNTFIKNMNLNGCVVADDITNGKKELDAILTKNGVVIAYLSKPFSSGDYHWVVITDKVVENGVDKYKIWTSTNISQMFQTYTFDYLYGVRVGNDWLRMGLMP